LFFRSITTPEQKHLANALTFELSKVETEAIRLRMLGHLFIVDKPLGEKVADALGAKGKAEKIVPMRNPIELKPSPALRLYGKYEPTLKGRKVGILLGAGFDATLKKELAAQIERAGAKIAVITSKIQGELDSQGRLHAGDMALRASPSVLFDAVAVISGAEGDKKLAEDPNAVAFLMDAKRHCKAVGFSDIPLLSKRAGGEKGPGIGEFTDSSGVKAFVKAAQTGRFWTREVE
jgi:catalase